MTRLVSINQHCATIYARCLPALYSCSLAKTTAALRMEIGADFATDGLRRHIGSLNTSETPKRIDWMDYTSTGWDPKKDRGQGLSPGSRDHCRQDKLYPATSIWPSQPPGFRFPANLCQKYPKK